MPLRCAWAAHPSHCLCAGETLPMWKPTTGEPYAGEPHVRFGGRGGATPLPDPYRNKGFCGSDSIFPTRSFALLLCSLLPPPRRIFVIRGRAMVIQFRAENRCRVHLLRKGRKWRMTC